MLRADPKNKSFVLPLTFVATISTALAACGSTHTEELSDVRVLNGVPMTLDERPEVIQIRATGGNTGQFCSATWIGRNTLVTAAHCLKKGGQTLNKVTISQGIGEGKVATKMVRHPQYVQSGYVNDIAVVIFDEPVVTSAIKIARVDPAVNSAVQIVGFGLLDTQQRNSGRKKRAGTNSIISVDTKILTRGRARPAANAPGSEAAIALGDSGGALLQGDKIIGISSSTSMPNNGWVKSYFINVARHTALFQRAKTEYGAEINGL